MRNLIKISALFLLSILLNSCATVVETTKIQEYKWNISEHDYKTTDQTYILKNEFIIKKETITLVSKGSELKFNIFDITETTDEEGNNIVVYDCKYLKEDVRITHFIDMDFIMIFSDMKFNRYQNLMLFGN